MFMKRARDNLLLWGHLLLTFLLKKK